RMASREPLSGAAGGAGRGGSGGGAGLGTSRDGGFFRSGTADPRSASRRDGKVRTGSPAGGMAVGLGSSISADDRLGNSDAPGLGVSARVSGLGVSTDFGRGVGPGVFDG